MAAQALTGPLAQVARWLATPLHPRRYLELINPLWTDLPRARIEAIRPETADVVSLTLRPNHLWRGARAGQYVRLGVDIDGVRHWRCYSISSALAGSESTFVVTVGRVEGGRVSTHIQERLGVGDLVALEPAMGDFVLPDGPLPGLLFISGGTGITPMMGMRRTLEAAGREADLVHLHFAPDRASCVFREDLEALDGRPGMRSRILYTRGGGRHFDAELLEAVCPDWHERELYLCGPRGLMDAVRAHWQAAGKRDRLHEESFQPLRAAVAEGEGGEVRFRNAGRSTRGEGDRPLLEVAEQAGLLPKHGCRMGICRGCLVTLREGQVRDLGTGEVFGEPGESVRLCVCAAAGNVTLDL